MHKDIRIARQAATELGVTVPSAAVADEILTRAEGLGHGHRDIAAIHEVLAQLSQPPAPLPLEPQSLRSQATASRIGSHKLHRREPYKSGATHPRGAVQAN